MSVCWMFIILLVCKVSHATESPSTCPCSEKLEILCLPVNVPCPKVKGQKMKFKLLKGGEVISNVSCNFENNSMSCSRPHGRNGVTLHKGKANESVSFILTVLMDSSHGTYRCEATVTFPPPYKQPQSGLNIHVLAQEDGHKIYTNSSVCCVEPKPGNVWIWILVVALLSAYSLIITIITFVNVVKLNRMDPQSDYINTKPRVPRERGKKKWALNPIPRHF